MAKKKDEYKKANIKIMQQGAPVVNRGFVIVEGKNIVALLIDLKSKHCEMECATGGDDDAPGILIAATKKSQNLHKKIIFDKATAITFPDYVDWNVFAVTISKCSASVCMIKK